MRLLLLGGGGLVGREVCDLARFRGIDHYAPTRAEVDICRAGQLDGALSSLSPDVVVNAAAYTDVDGAESDARSAYAVNAHAPRRLAELCRRHKCALVHLSTDCVFGHRPECGPTGRHAEDDTPHPLSVYGESKLAGERAVAETLDAHIVLRTSWVLGRKRRGFVAAVVARILRHDSVQVVEDSEGCVTPVEDLAGAIVNLAVGLAARRYSPGVLHYCGRDVVSRIELARTVVDEVVSKTGIPAPAIEKRLRAEMDVAMRPRISSLDCRRYQALSGEPLPDWRPALARTVTWLCAAGVVSPPDR